MADKAVDEKPVDDKPDHHSNVHGHSVHADDSKGAHYLRKLDSAEAKTIFQQAKARGDAKFETRSPRGVRTNYSLGDKAGRYTLKNQGEQK